MKIWLSMWCLISLLFLLGGTPVFGQLTVEGFQPQKNLFPVVGKASLVKYINAPKKGQLRVTYRPGSAVSHVEKFDMLDGKLSWKPTAAGIVKLVFGTLIPGKGDEDGTFKPLGDKKVISVRSESSILGFGIMFLAALILFGGAAYSIRSLLSSD